MVAITARAGCDLLIRVSSRALTSVVPSWVVSSCHPAERGRGRGIRNMTAPGAAGAGRLSREARNVAACRRSGSRLQPHRLVRRRLPGRRNHHLAHRRPGSADERDLRAAWRDRLVSANAEVVVDLYDAVGHPGGADHRVTFGPGVEVAAKRHRVAAGVDGDVAVVGDQRVAVQGVLHQPGDVDRSAS
jgi:hypothetical protein